MIKWDSFLGWRAAINQPGTHINRRMDKNYMILTIDAEKKAFDKIQYNFLINTLKKVSIEGKPSRKSG